MLRTILLAGLLAALSACSTTGGAYVPPPSRTIPGMTQAQVRDQLVTRCASRGFNIASSDPSHIICDRNAGIVASALLQTGVGPPPRYQFHAVTAQLTDGVMVTGYMVLQTYTWTGAPDMSESGMNATQRAEVEMVLNDLQPPGSANTPVTPAAPTASENPRTP